MHEVWVDGGHNVTAKCMNITALNTMVGDLVIVITGDCDFYFLELLQKITLEK